MAYIQPNSTVEFFADIGIDSNYENTLYFASIASKDSYFNSLTKIATATALSYSRETRGFIRVELPMSTLINVGYMRFKNTSFENKWWYAFVTSVEYINNVTTQVNFILDVMMTWMGGFSLNQCFIERQHTLGDSIGANIAYENIPVGEYVCEGSSTTALFGDYYIVLFRSMHPSSDPNEREVITPAQALKQGTCAPILATFYEYSTGGVTSLINKLEDLVEKNRGDEIIGIKLVPYYFGYSADLTAVPFTVTKPYTGSNAWGNFTPKNKKLYCFPYKYLEVENCEGESANYKYEYFNSLPDATSSGDCTFRIKGTSCTPEINIMCYPENYNGIDADIAHGLKMSDFPSIAWNVDGYRAYIAQRDSTLFANIVSSAEVGGTIGAIVGGVPGALIGAGAGALKASAPMLADNANKILGILSNGELPSRAPSQTKGTLSSNLLVQSRQKNFYFRKMCITKNYAQMIDSYFDMYGYAIRQHGVPNMNARPYWTYVKTVGCSVDGNLPADDGARIEQIFDNGVRFWKDHTKIGQYSNYNNSPV